MLDLKFIRENADLVKTNCQNRLATVDVDKLLSLDQEVRTLIASIEKARAERNQASKTKPTPETIAAMKALGEAMKVQEESLATKEASLKELIMAVPNLTHPEVKVSDNEDDNPVLEICGKIPQFKFTPKDHVELAASLDLIDFDRATKVSGAKFYYLKNELALLEYALIQYSLNILLSPYLTDIHPL